MLYKKLRYKYFFIGASLLNWFNSQILCPSVTPTQINRLTTRLQKKLILAGKLLLKPWHKIQEGLQNKGWPNLEGYRPSKVSLGLACTGLAGLGWSYYKLFYSNYQDINADGDLGCNLPIEELFSVNNNLRSDKIIHIFVHGTKGKKVKFAYNIGRIMADRVEQDGPLFTATANPKEKWGLQARTNAAQPLFPTGEGYKLFTTLQNKLNPETNNEYHSFTWSGVLSHKWRSYAALELYHSLMNLPNAELRLYGFSHGGSILMLLTKVHYYLTWYRQQIKLGKPTQGLCDINDTGFVEIAEQYIAEHPEIVNPEQSLIHVNQICLLDTPLQEETRHLALNYFADKYIVLHSPRQIKDFISTKGRQSYSHLSNQSPHKAEIIHCSIKYCNNLGKRCTLPTHSQFGRTKGHCIAPIVGYVPAILKVLEHMAKENNKQIYELKISENAANRAAGQIFCNGLNFTFDFS